MEEVLEKNLFDEATVSKAMTYEKYYLLIKDLLEKGLTTGNNQSESYLNYTKLNFQRMKRVYRTTTIDESLRQLLIGISKPQTWYVLTEGWCGDAAQILPAIARFSELSPNINLKILLRDENETVMNMHLTNGSKSIPKIIAIEDTTGKELFVWGPRPAEFQEMAMDHKNDPTESYESFSNRLHKHYSQDKTASVQSEFIQLLTRNLEKQKRASR